MSRNHAVCLCAVVALIVLTGAHLVNPAPVLAASGTLSTVTPLHEAPDHGAPLVALLPEGAVVSIEGPPVNGFYPVIAGDLSGWMRGETLLLEKDVPEEGVAATPAADATGELVPAAQTTGDEMAPVDGAVLGDPATDPALTEAPLAEAPPADPAVTEPVAGVTDADPAVNPSDPIALPPEAAAVDPAASDAAAPEDGTKTLAADSPAATALASEVPAEEATDPLPTPDPNVTPVPVPEPGPLGPASVTVDAPIRTGPGPDYGLVFTVPLGSTVERTGQLIDGYVSVQYKEVTGWIALGQLGEPTAFVEEPLPEAPVETVAAKTPRPGSGVAFTTADMSLRAGPSANEEPTTVVPAGSRVVLTGVMEGGFQRVSFDDQIGWIADEYLQTPADPETSVRRNGKEQSYSRQHIERIIYDAADSFGQSRSDMLRVAECESNLDPYAVNPSGSYGLFQFIRSTWKSTPYGSEDIFDPRANANAAAWMWSQGRKSEWVCQ